MFQKKIRTSNKELMREYHSKKCLLCNLKATPSHIKTRGSGGPDEPWNIVPLCFNHHVFWGKVGWRSFCQKFPAFETLIKSLGWYELNGKLFNDKLK
jgi:hypothetical protein